MLSGLEVRNPNEFTARPSPQYPVRFHDSPVCDPPLQRLVLPQMTGD